MQPRGVGRPAEGAVMSSPLRARPPRHPIVIGMQESKWEPKSMCMGGGGREEEFIGFVSCFECVCVCGGVVVCVWGGKIGEG